jgi:hypothetical protein
MIKSIALLVIAILIIDVAVLSVFFFQQSGKLNTAGANITGLEAQASTLVGEATALRNSISSLQASISASVAKVTALQASLKESDGNATALQAALNQLNTYISNLNDMQTNLPPPPPPIVFNATGPAAFVVTDLKINETLIQPWDVGTVSVNVTNTGGQTGTYQVVLKLNGEVFATKPVTLDGGKSVFINFGVKPPKEMHAVITIDNLTVEADWLTH